MSRWKRRLTKKFHKKFYCLCRETLYLAFMNIDHILILIDIRLISYIRELLFASYLRYINNDWLRSIN